MRNFVVLLFVFVFVSGFSQPHCSIRHYSDADGLSQNTIMHMLQDRTGNMWFATWDGLNRFDGHRFTIFKPRPGDQVNVVNSRFDYIVEDHYGYIWVLTYDRKVLRFDPRSRLFSNFPALGDNVASFPKSIRQILVHTDGSIWLASESGEGLVKVWLDKDGVIVKSKVFSTETGFVMGNQVVDMVEDSRQNVWVLTDNGVTLFKHGTTDPVVFFYETPDVNGGNRQQFNAMVEFDQEIWFGVSAGRIWRYDIQGGRFNLLETGVRSSVKTLNKVGESILVGTDGEGLVLFSRRGELLNRFSVPRMPSGVVQHVFVDSYGEAWVQQDYNGITQITPASGQVRVHRTFTEYNEAATSLFHPSFHILEDGERRLWVHPVGGGFSYFDRQLGALKSFYNDPRDPARLFSNMLHSMYSDRQGNLWLCTRSKGLERVTFYNPNFRIIKPGAALHEPFVNDVRSLMQDRDGRYWVATKDGRVHIFSANFVFIGYLTESGQIATSGKPVDGIQYSMLQDLRGNIWLGSKGKGLVKMVPASSTGALSYRMVRFRYQSDDLYSLSNDNIYHIHEDGKGRIWVATYGGGLNYIDESSDGQIRFINHRNHMKGYPIGAFYRVRHINSVPGGDIYVGTTNGLLTFNEDFVDAEQISFRKHAFKAGDPTCLSNNDVHYVISTRDQQVFVATFGGGINKVEKSSGKGELRFRAYTTAHGLPSDVILGMSEDSHGNVWISTENGLVKFDPVAETFERYQENGFGEQAIFSEASTMIDRNGVVYFGMDKGLLQFNPADVKRSEFVPSVVLTDLYLSNKLIDPHSDNSILPIEINALSELVLPHDKKMVSIAYAALDYKNPDNVSYAYLLEGFDSEWNYVGQQRVATYTNLPKGEYRLRVKSTNSDGVWVDNEKVLMVRVLPSFWETAWAYVVYFLFFMFVVALGGYILFIIYRLKGRVSLEHHLAELKLTFFTNISHELRTPLTLIAGPVEHMLESQSLPAQTREELVVVQSNTRRMLRLINQILDFVKIQNKKMQLKVEEVLLADVTQSIMTNFTTLAAEHDIDFSLTDLTNGSRIYVDVDKYEKIVFNLLSNAFKFTPRGRRIAVTIDDANGRVALRVADSGTGIPENKRQMLFQRFESFIDKNLFDLPGTGIGLSLVKELADMHGAEVDVESREGEGTTFTLLFRRGIEHFDADTEIIIADNAALSVGDSVPVMDDVTEDVSCDIETTATSILIVEDNAELRAFLRKILIPEYLIYEAVDGEQALKVASEHVPDLILSDWMMPGMNGLELLRHLRENVNTSHIPFVMLTAKTDIDSKIEGLETGADDYITKPFSTSYLLARIQNLLAQREKLQQLYRTNMPTRGFEVVPSQPQIQSQDQKFMEQLIGYMEQNIDNGNLVVDDLVSHMAVSRSVFFKKLKTITGLAPIEFIREIRVKRAAQLIESGEFNMTQISYMVGINDPRYFSKCFKQHFGMTPSEYKEHLKK
ncbi:MAG: response regulator [Marinilabiliaceae bacterium]|nr:response regulator [Marinilabiliaceae bacterium]